ERDRPRGERLLRQAEHHDRVLAAGEEQDRPLELGHHLAHDEDRLGFEGVQVGHAVGGLGHGRSYRGWRTSARVASSRGARSLRQTTMSGRSGSGRLYASGAPSIRLACRPVAIATATGAAESHSYWPPACT